MEMIGEPASGLLEAGYSEAIASSLNSGYPTATTSFLGRYQPADLMVLLGLLFTVGTGGFTAPAYVSTFPSTSPYVVDARATTVHDVPATSGGNDELAVSVTDRLRAVRRALSLNVSQLAEAMQVGRPAIYSWLRGASPRRVQLQRLKQLYDIATDWSRRHSGPVGKLLIAPLEDGESLVSLLMEPEIDIGRVQRALSVISDSLSATESRRQRSGYRSVASVMKEYGISSAPDDIGQLRIDALNDESLD